MRSLTHVAILFLLLCNMPAAGQPLRLSFQNFSEKEGLSDNNVISFFQDSRGYLWICTGEGLSRFDGFTFKKFYSNNKNSLPSNIINFIMEYKPGILLVATSNGLVRLNMITNTFDTISDSTVATKPIHSLHQNTDGSFIAGYTDGLGFLDSNLHLTDFIPTLPSPYWQVIFVHKLRSGELLAATTKGYFFIDKKNRKLLPLSEQFSDPGFPQYLMFSYYDSLSNSLYTSQWERGLYIVNLSDKKVEHYVASPGCASCLTTNRIYCAYRDQQQNVWIGSNNGIFQLDRINKKLNHVEYQSGETSELYHDVIMKIYEDKSQNIWFGTPAGISRLNPKAQNIRQYKNEFLVNGEGTEINGILRGNDGRIYVSTYGNGIFAIDERTKTIENIGKAVMPFNWSVSKSGNNIVATGHDKRMYIYYPSSKKTEVQNFLIPFYGKSNLLLFEFTHSNGDKWYSLNEGSGLVQYSVAEKKYYHFTNKDIPKPFSENYFSHVAEDENGNLWFGVNKSSHIVCWELKTRKFKTIDFAQAYEKKRSNFGGISGFVINGKEIWVATGGTGVVLYDIPTGSTSVFSINEGLAGDDVSAVVIDKEKRLWACTAKGLSCKLPGQKYFTSFGLADGLPEINFNEGAYYYDSLKNRLYLGAGKSMLVINPENLLRTRSLAVQAHLDGIKVNGEILDYDENKVSILSYDQNNLQFNFSVVDLNSSSGINLFYRLAGADKDWINTEGQRTASYINLPAGKYKLNLKISRLGSDFSAYNVPFSFEIKQAWWQTLWFRSLLVLTCLSVLYLIVRMYYRGKMEHQQMLFEKKQAVEQERSRIATDMHDDLGAGLTGIKFLSDNITEQNISTDAKERLEKLKVSANNLIESMGEIIWAMNERNNTLGDLLFHLRSYSLTYCEENNLLCHFSLPENVGEHIVNGHTRRNIFLIIKESLHNIVKHANAHSINISVAIKKDLVFSIQDDGKGYVPTGKAGNGLINMQKRAKDMNGNFSISKNDKGTLVQVNIPLA